MTQLVFILLASLSAFAAPTGAEKEMRECQLSQDRFLFLQDYKVTCNQAYFLFASKETRRETHKTIDMAAFNILRTGTEQTRFKNYQYVARIMNQWDLVATVELMPTSLSIIAHNRKIDKVRKQFNKHKESYGVRNRARYHKLLDKSYRKPGFLRILEDLQKLDPSWSLVLSPKPTGDNAFSNELSGFYFRASSVQLSSTQFCQGRKGCLLPIKKSAMQLISRVPFVARFKSGSLDFHAVALHLRFRETQPSCADTPFSERCLNLTATERRFSEKFRDVSSKLKRSRFVELAIISDSIKNSPHDFMLMGDFNLDFESDNSQETDYWRRALNNQNQKVLVTTKTSVSEQNGLANSYDHFVIDQKPGSSLNNCKTQTAKAFNFLIGTAGSIPRALSPMGTFLKRRQRSKQSVFDDFEDYIDTKEKLTNCTETECSTDAFFAERDLIKYSDGYVDRILTDRTKRKAVPYRVHIELVSDHLPISMKCSSR